MVFFLNKYNGIVSIVCKSRRIRTSWQFDEMFAGWFKGGHDHDAQNPFLTAFQTNNQQIVDEINRKSMSEVSQSEQISNLTTNQLLTN